MDSKSKYTSLDTSFILRFVLLDNQPQLIRAKEMLINGGEYYVDGVAIMECVYVMTKNGFSRKEMIGDIRDFLLNPSIHYHKDFFDPIFQDYISHPSLSFDDLVLAARVEEKGYTPLYTFDQKFAHQSKVAKLVPTA
ncbi:PIN domain-containing protein [Candidatus Saccharibacteria bacterium]|nr:PIN domain-containing protein [Candidatus Saccharibacteria bacterium]